ncbi:unnamed protein product [Candidula unifasciata]|uniref:Sulfotransferase domain-containing protein n=1 Tax=Candidula unifasciata TaxID=100452 RepID=A0A8S3ZJD0_9EUPU|nr:unnamed protein product [Candidula unifasciata]
MADQATAHLVNLRMNEIYGLPVEKNVSDEDGNSLRLGVLDGRLVPPFGESNYRKLPDIPIRDDDVVLIGYPKTGCHWTWQIMSMIVEGKPIQSELGKGISFLEFASREMIEDLPSRRILNTHLWLDYLPRQVKEKKTKIVFTVRNPKDTAVSFYNHHKSLINLYGYKGPFNKWFSLFMEGQVDYGSYFDYHKEWDRAIDNNPDLPILIVSYEDMKEDLPREIRKLSEFVGATLSDQQVEVIAQAAGFDTMKQALSSSVSHKLLRKGEVGDWKNWLTVAQSEMVDDAVEQKLKGTRFASPRYTI